MEELKQNESIKLVKNTKGYNWEIKILPIISDTEDTRLSSEDIARLDNLNEAMVQKYGCDCDCCDGLKKNCILYDKPEVYNESKR